MASQSPIPTETGQYDHDDTALPEDLSEDLSEDLNVSDDGFASPEQPEMEDIDDLDYEFHEHLANMHMLFGDDDVPHARRRIESPEWPAYQLFFDDFPRQLYAGQQANPIVHSPSNFQDLYEPMPAPESDEGDEPLTCHICMESMTTDVSLASPADVSENVEDINSSSHHPEAQNSGDVPPHPELAVTLKKCSHSFGRTCLLKWLSQSRTCPMCRASLSDDPDQTATDDSWANFELK